MAHYLLFFKVLTRLIFKGDDFLIITVSGSMVFLNIFNIYFNYMSSIFFPKNKKNTHSLFLEAKYGDT